MQDFITNQIYFKFYSMFLEWCVLYKCVQINLDRQNLMIILVSLPYCTSLSKHVILHGENNMMSELRI